MKIEYIINIKSVLNELKPLEPTDLSFENFHNHFSFSTFLDGFGDSKILFWDNENKENSLLIKGSVLSFCYQSYAAWKDLKNKKSEKVRCWGNEQGDFSIEYYLDNKKIYCKTHNYTYVYLQKSFHKSLKDLVDELINELPFYYPKIEKSIYFGKFKDDLL
ncbi:hypothetical protein WAF17_09155 [Bernardetia sp. ABR2-2B]|uniref:hypothetical protein n=1 Tax=Bernardetia sp. ABR2-2B TaxID=3127472 RepID=UPI0030D1A4A9